MVRVGKEEGSLFHVRVVRRNNRDKLRTFLSRMSFLPGQPIPIPRGPTLQLGPGTYSRDGQVRSSIMGVPRFEGSVCIFVISTDEEITIFYSV